jgi:hypothetical protein
LRQKRRRKAELRLVLEWHTEQPADDRHRQGIGEVFDDLEPALLGDPVKQSIDKRADIRLQRVHHFGCEGLADQFAQPGVIGRVEEQKSRWGLRG